jgi:hypothetical protein
VERRSRKEIRQRLEDRQLDREILGEAPTREDRERLRRRREAGEELTDDEAADALEDINAPGTRPSPPDDPDEDAINQIL